MKNVLITGASGFIGSHLCEKFIQEGFEVYGIDNLITGDINNLDKLKDSPSFHFKEDDITMDLDLKLNFDLILHFAGPASPDDFLRLSLETLKSNSLGTLKTLELAQCTGARYVFASTSEIYGDPLIHPQDESYWGNVNPIGRRSVYNEAKRFSEALSIAFHQKYNLDVRIPRIFNTYGPNMKVDDGRVIPNFIVQALKDESLTVYGNGSQTRSLCYINDLVEGIFKISSIDNIDGQVINLGNPEEHSIMDLARIIIKKTGSNSDIIHKSLPQDDPRRRCPDITRARNVLGWQPITMLDSGLEETIKFFRNKINE
jgi:nucleoside-diphosphate-sugar epimerase